MSLEVQLNPAVSNAQDTGPRSASPPATPSGQGVSAATTGNPQGAPAAVSEQNLAATVTQLNSHVQQIRRGLQFVIDKESGHVIVKVIDTQSKQVIRQIPPADIIALWHHLKDLSGHLLHAKA